MKPRIGVYLSQDVAARLAVAVAVQSPGTSRSALVEAAIDRFLGPDDDAEQSVNGRLGVMSHQLEQLACDLRMVSEAVALQARFHLAMAPRLPEAALRKACMRGSERFDEFAAQVGRRLHQGSSLMRETMDRLGASKQDSGGSSLKEEAAPPTDISDSESDFHVKTVTHEASDRIAFLAQGGRPDASPKSTGRPSAQSINSRAIGHREATTAERNVKSSVSVPSSDADRYPAQTWKLILRVFLPFVAAYYLSFLFRTINATIAGSLVSEFGLGAGSLGLLASVYFFTFAAAQIPIGILLDRYGPRRIQSAMLLVAAAGAALFSIADNFMSLLAGRALIGLGVAAAMTAGIKALVLWFPGNRIPLLNGFMIMLAALGAVTATLPAEFLLTAIGWRGLFELLAFGSFGCAIVIYLVVPRGVPIQPASGLANVGLRTIYADQRFWRLAPLSATCIGTAWSLQGLWAAPWFSDVEGLDRSALLQELFVMAIALSLGALVLGVAADRLRRRGVVSEALLGYATALFIVAQLALILRLPVPLSMPWVIVAAIGAATVLSYAILAEYFPKESAGRANAALNVFHIGGAFVLQYLTGVVVQFWPPVNGHYPAIAYQTALAINVGLQIAAGIWFAIPWIERICRNERRQLRIWSRTWHA